MLSTGLLFEVVNVLYPAPSLKVVQNNFSGKTLRKETKSNQSQSTLSPCELSTNNYKNIGSTQLFMILHGSELNFNAIYNKREITKIHPISAKIIISSRYAF
jgi:hypothetical protein